MAGEKKEKKENKEKKEKKEKKEVSSPFSLRKYRNDGIDQSIKASGTEAFVRKKQCNM